MHFINPFRGLRPADEEKASSVPIPSTDHLSESIITNHKKDNPWNYLNIFNNKVYSKAKDQFELMKILSQPILLHIMMRQCHHRINFYQLKIHA